MIVVGVIVTHAHYYMACNIITLMNGTARPFVPSASRPSWQPAPFVPSKVHVSHKNPRHQDHAARRQPRYPQDLGTPVPSVLWYLPQAAGVDDKM